MAGSDKFTLLTCKRTVIHNKIHCDCRLGYFLERDWGRMFNGADRVADMDIRNTGDCDNGTDASLCHFHFL